MGQFVSAHRDRRNPRWIPVTVLLISLSLTAGASFSARKYFMSEHSARFAKSKALILDTLRSKIHSYLTLLSHIRGLIDATPGLSQESFDRYVGSIDFAKLYPGVKSIGYLEPVKGPAPAFRMKFMGPPSPENSPLPGVNPYAEPERRRSMDLARDTGELAATRRVTLMRDLKKRAQPAFIVYAPLYRRGKPVETFQQRRSALIGFVSAAFRADDFFKSLLPVELDRDLDIDFEVFGDETPRPENLLHNHARGLRGFAPQPNADFSSVVPFQVAGRIWTVALFSSRGFVPATATLIPAFLLIFGVVFSFLVSFFVWKNQERAETEALANRRTQFLYEVTRELFTSSLESEERIRNFVRALVPRFADWAGAMLLEENGEIRRVAFQGPEGTEELSRKILKSYPVDLGASQGLGRVLRTRQPHMVKSAQPDEIGRQATSAEAAGYLAIMRMSCSIVVPMEVGGRMLGALVLIGTDGRRYDEADLELAMELGRRTAVAVENANLYKEAKDAIQARDEFISIASHELKTPLTTLKLHAQIQRRSAKAEMESKEAIEKLKSMADTADQQVNRIARLVDEMLDVSRIRSGKLALDRQRFDLAQAVREACELSREQLADAGCVLSLSCPEPVVGYWDKQRLEQVFLNLLSNAIKYGANGPVEVSVTLSGSRAKLQVTDHGMGIAPEDHGRIFQRFERAVSGSRISGMGLGLYIVQQIVGAHEGSVSVASARGTGSTFTVEVPLLPGGVESGRIEAPASLSGRR